MSIQKIFLSVFFWSSFVFIFPLFSQPEKITLEAIFDKQGPLSTPPSPPMTWRADGLSWICYNPVLGQFVKEEAHSGKREPLYDAAAMEKALVAAGIPEASARGLSRSSDYVFDQTLGQVLLIEQEDIFCYTFEKSCAVRITQRPGREEEMDFSPDGRYVSFVRDKNLYVVDLEIRQEKALTQDGGERIFNGYLDWIYQEEVYGRGNFRGYWWSPDSSKIAFLKLDESNVKKFPIIDHIPNDPEIQSDYYPKAGDPHPGVKLCVADVKSGAIREIELGEYAPDAILLVKVAWCPRGKLSYQIQDRIQSWLHLCLADPETGKSEIIVKESSPYWVEPQENPCWISDDEFLWLSERDGWKHLYHYRGHGELVRQVTRGEWEVRELCGVDREWVYFSSTHHSPIERHTYRIKMDGTKMARLTQEPGTHETVFSPVFSGYLDSWSDIETPLRVAFYDMNGKLIRQVHQNPPIDRYRFNKPQFLQVKTKDNFVMEAMMIRPPDFESSRKYPVLCYVYAGPHSQSVRNVWGRRTYFWHQAMAEKGYIVWLCDNRSASGKGAASGWPIHRNFGESELGDIEEGIAWLKKQPYVDPERIGIWGWSFGGYMTAYALTHSKSFKAGISVAPVTDWHNYDSVYTEKYMGLPKDNPLGYKKSSALLAARNLSGRLLLVHGTMDDNVHLQNALQFAYALQRAGKLFDLMLYPKSMHGISDFALQKHLYHTMTEFLEKNL